MIKLCSFILMMAVCMKTTAQVIVTPGLKSGAANPPIASVLTPPNAAKASSHTACDTRLSILLNADTQRATGNSQPGSLRVTGGGVTRTVGNSAVSDRLSFEGGIVVPAGNAHSLF